MSLERADLDETIEKIGSGKDCSHVLGILFALSSERLEKSLWKTSCSIVTLCSYLIRILIERVHRLGKECIEAIIYCKGGIQPNKLLLDVRCVKPWDVSQMHRMDIEGILRHACGFP